jgi:maltose-binding protein MalE
MENKGLSIKTRTDRKPQIKLVTKSFKELTELRKEFYNEQGKKIIPKTIDTYISEEFLTYLYLDVGYIFNDNYIIEVTKYTIDDCRYLAQLIFQNLNLKCEVIEEKKSLKKMIILIEQKKMTQILLQNLQ